MLRPLRKGKIACRNRKLPASANPVSCNTEYFKPPRTAALAVGSAIFTGDYEARIDVSEAMIHVALGSIPLRRIAH